MNYLFETRRLGVRRFQQSDVSKIYMHHKEESLKKWIPNESYETIDEAREAIEFFNENSDEGELPFVLAIELKENNELIGDAGINESPGGIEIGYSICEAYQGNGYATEALQGFTKYAVQNFSFTELYGRVVQGNNASCRVLEKAGYKYVNEEFDADDDPYGKGMLVYKLEV
ncbi:GNAT family N-acetyltransferase [Oceanirhabdus sp. W0125-5]|uniref:GNAT family N-acetyltransferase n=1 Tax=Oceanirhabdus sp. W0125-5 TaxID=2999116 RepID=UPI0022F3043C|nr:GNAT family N-acetyltransferase [Oceanirhabdus sp. W0125-5]WBW95029.1 GNAT family N-acetyltransferase [Oceanirhabdus sp. W0125-5]